MDFLKVIYENVKKKQKNIPFTASTSTSKGHRHFEVLKFYFVHIVKVCFVFKKQSLCLYSPVYASNTSNIRGNEKEQ